jgi:hypothetical protein
LKIILLIFENKWFDSSNKDARSLINIANFMLDLYEVFKGSFIAERLINHSRDILLTVMGLGGKE